MRLHGLDGLRGLAALLVFVHHYLAILALYGQAWAGSVISTIDLGKLGVCLFFLISGFVIPFSLKNGLAAFWIGRAARLLPALWLSILLCLALGYPLESAAQLLANAFMVTRATGQADISVPYWTLNWELYFYGIVAVAYALGCLKSPRTFGLLAIACGFGMFVEARITYLLFMFTGTLLRFVLLDRNESAKVWLCVALAVLVGNAFLWALFSARPPEFFAGLALALPLFLIFWNRATNPALIWLGGISYSLYLFHLPIMAALSDVVALPAFVVLGAALPFIVGHYVYRWVEKPAMRLTPPVQLHLGTSDEVLRVDVKKLNACDGRRT